MFVIFSTFTGLEVTIIAAVFILQLASTSAHHPRHALADDARVMLVLIDGRVGGGVGWQGGR